MSSLLPHGRGLRALLGDSAETAKAAKAASEFDLWLVQMAYGEADKLIEVRLFRPAGWLDAWRRGELELSDSDVQEITRMRARLQAEFHQDREVSHHRTERDGN